jgi:hypothetical protein
VHFENFGPYPLPRSSRGGVSTVREDIVGFWDNVEQVVEGLPDAVGCYVFGISSGGGVLPWYVGKAERQAFWQECCAHHKLSKYNEAMDLYERGTPVLFLIAGMTNGGAFVRPTAARNGRPAIAKLEELLIGMALQRNGELVNIRGLAWTRFISFPGVIQPKAGKPSDDLVNFRHLMGLHR